MQADTLSCNWITASHPRAPALAWHSSNFGSTSPQLAPRGLAAHCSTSLRLSTEVQPRAVGLALQKSTFGITSSQWPAFQLAEQERLASSITLPHAAEFGLATHWSSDGGGG